MRAGTVIRGLVSCGSSSCVQEEEGSLCAKECNAVPLIKYRSHFSGAPNFHFKALLISCRTHFNDTRGKFVRAAHVNHIIYG